MSEARRFEGKVGVVTGGGTGIGAATARRIVAEGGRVLVAGVDGSTVQAVAASLPERTAAWLEVDVAAPDAGERILAAAEELGPVDVLLNAAGVAWFAPGEEVGREDWERVFAVNVHGLMFVTQAIGRRMIERGKGSIVNIASMAGVAGVPEHSSYVASKHAVVGLTRSLAIEWARKGVRVNAHCPGLTDTLIVREAAEQSPDILAQRARRNLLGRLARPEEQAAMICFMLSDDASYVNGHVAIVDGGNDALYSGYSPTWYEEA
jgi:NAD(P)-dependent dehydrogenase (short-subunit alcohol dehydrogenase family)